MGGRKCVVATRIACYCCTLPPIPHRSHKHGRPPHDVVVRGLNVTPLELVLPELRQLLGGKPPGKRRRQRRQRKEHEKKAKVVDHGHGGVAHTRSRKPDSIPLPHVSSPLGWLMPADRLCGLHTVPSKYLSMGESSWLTCRYRGIAERVHRAKIFPQQSPTLRQSSQATHGQQVKPRTANGTSRAACPAISFPTSAYHVRSLIHFLDTGNGHRRL